MKGIITIIVIIAIIVVGFLMLKDGTNNPQVTSDEQTQAIEDEVKLNDSLEIALERDEPTIDTTAEVIIVAYNDDGFTPKDISITQGQTVRFVNSSSGNMWVASAFHPTHEEFPEFDHKKSVGNGESYDFTFMKVGEWAYHNHVKPNAFGKVIVE